MQYWDLFSYLNCELTPLPQVFCNFTVDDGTGVDVVKGDSVNTEMNV